MESLAQRTLSECERLSPIISALEEKVGTFIGSCTTLSASRAVEEAGELRGEAGVLERSLEALAPYLKELRAGGYHDLAHTEQR